MTEPTPPPRSSVRVSRIRGGERTWAIVVIAQGDTEDDVRESLRIATQLDSDLAARYSQEQP